MGARNGVTRDTFPQNNMARRLNLSLNFMLGKSALNFTIITVYRHDHFEFKY